MYIDDIMQCYDRATTSSADIFARNVVRVHFLVILCYSAKASLEKFRRNCNVILFKFNNTMYW